MTTSIVRLHVGGLTPDVVAEELADRFRSFGDVQAVDLIPDKLPERAHLCRGFGYVTLAFRDGTRGDQNCIRALNGTVWNGMKLSLQVAKPSFAMKQAEEQHEAKRQVTVKRSSSHSTRSATHTLEGVIRRDTNQNDAVKLRIRSAEELAGSGAKRCKKTAGESWKEPDSPGEGARAVHDSEFKGDMDALQDVDGIQEASEPATEEDLREERARSLNIIEGLQVAEDPIGGPASDPSWRGGGRKASFGREFVKLRYFDPLAPDKSMERKPGASFADLPVTAEDDQGYKCTVGLQADAGGADFSFGFDVGADEADHVQAADYGTDHVMSSPLGVAEPNLSSEARGRAVSASEPAVAQDDSKRLRESGAFAAPATFFEPMSTGGDAMRLWVQTRERATVDYKNKARAAQRQARKLNTRRAKH